MPSPTSALLPVANTLAVGVRSFVLQQYYTFEYDLGLWAFGAVQVIKDRRSGTLKTCKAVEKTRLMDVHGTGDRLRRLTEIQHPMLLPVTDILEDSSHFFIISPHAAGGDMGDWLDRLASDEEVIEEETCDLAESGGLLLLWVVLVIFVAWGCNLANHDFVQTLLAEDVECTAPLALSHPWLRNVLLRPGLADDLAREDALRRLACYQAALLLVPVEMAHRDLERLLKDFQRMDQDGDALLASRLAMQLLLARRGATKRGSEVAVGVCDVRGCGTVDFSAMAAAALMADLLPDGFMKQRVDDMWSALQQLFFEAYGSDDGMVDRSVVLEKVSNSVGGLLEKYGDVEFEEILGSFDDDIYQESFQSRLMDSAGHGTPMALFEWGFLAEEPDSWFASLYRSCGQPMRRREAVRC
ncbi:unnamed protein product [Durusdinium trenchii]|uniref:Protein kinase domain-containing protein n=1 Tax=Durusdinium trenchii TaxID=1381693 RepID=A0ABP0J5R3_9DINO